MIVHVPRFKALIAHTCNTDLIHFWRCEVHYTIHQDCPCQPAFPECPQDYVVQDIEVDEAQWNSMNPEEKNQYIEARVVIK